MNKLIEALGHDVQHQRRPTRKWPCAHAFTRPVVVVLPEEAGFGVLLGNVCDHICPELVVMFGGKSGVWAAGMGVMSECVQGQIIYLKI